MSQEPLVSIIIPTFNRAHLIGETLDSVLAQTYQNWECIVVDDGSTDDTDSVMKGYCDKDSRFKYYHRPDEHLPGGNGARNYGFEMSNGKYVSLLDSDDLLYEYALEDKIKYLGHDIDVLMTAHTRQKEKLRRTSTTVNKVINGCYDENFIMELPPVLIGDALISREFLGNHRFDEKQLRGQDHLFYIELFRKRGGYLKIDGVHYLYNETANSITKKAGGGQKKYFDAQVKIGEQMMEEYKHRVDIVSAYQRKSRQMYKSLILKGKVIRCLEYFNHFRKCYNLSFVEFAVWMPFNILTKKGFDRMKYNVTRNK